MAGAAVAARDAGAGAPPSLVLDGATAHYGGVQVLGPLSLELHAGERVALVGQSGAGKSTLLALLHERWRAHAALMPQELGLVQTLSVYHNVYMGRLSRHRTWYNLATLVRPFRTDVAEVGAILERLALADKLWARAGELSGGQRQRVAAARVLYQDGGVLLADEPVSALDGPMSELVMSALAECYPTAVFAMHDVELALRFTDRVIGIRQGHVALDAPSDTLTPDDLRPLY